MTQALAGDMAALQQFKQQPIAVMPEPLEVTAPLIYRSEQPAGGIICSSLMWTARNLVRPRPPRRTSLPPARRQPEGASMHGRMHAKMVPHVRCLPG